MRKVTSGLAALIGLILISGCSSQWHGYIKNRDTDYIQAKSVPPLAIPPGLSSSTINAYYPVPEHEYPTVTKPVNLTPPSDPR